MSRANSAHTIRAKRAAMDEMEGVEFIGWRVRQQQKDTAGASASVVELHQQFARRPSASAGSSSPSSGVRRATTTSPRMASQAPGDRAAAGASAGVPPPRLVTDGMEVDTTNADKPLQGSHKSRQMGKGNVEAGAATGGGGGNGGARKLGNVATAAAPERSAERRPRASTGSTGRWAAAGGEKYKKTPRVLGEGGSTNGTAEGSSSSSSSNKAKSTNFSSPTTIRGGGVVGGAHENASKTTGKPKIRKQSGRSLGVVNAATSGKGRSKTPSPPPLALGDDGGGGGGNTRATKTYLVAGQPGGDGNLGVAVGGTASERASARKKQSPRSISPAAAARGAVVADGLKSAVKGQPNGSGGGGGGGATAAVAVGSSSSRSSSTPTNSSGSKSNHNDTTGRSTTTTVSFSAAQQRQKGRASPTASSARS
ncbi:unnamed protein product, partial [Pylaiella littoralis]